MWNFTRSLVTLILALCLLASQGISSASAQDIYDPWEGMNRGIFSFNDTLDVYVLEPVASGYDWVLPEYAQGRVVNFFENLSYPKYLVSDLVQLKLSQAASHTGRFLINSTVGLLGLFDVATDMGLPKHVEDFGIALAYHGVPPGPYFVIPFWGPSTVRDAVGRLVDGFLNPASLIFYTGIDSDVAAPASIGMTALDIVQTRADLLDALKSAKEGSVDYYLFLQSSYMQYRKGLLYDGVVPDEEDIEED